MPAMPSDAPAPPRRAPRFRVRRLLLYLLYVLLILAAGVAIWGAPALETASREGTSSPVALVAATLLTAFVVAFALYRFQMVRAGRYHAGKAFVQVGFGILLLLVVLPGPFERLRRSAPAPPVDLTRQLASADAEARAMAAELTRHRKPQDAKRYVPRLVDLLSDPSAEVRRQARASLVDLAGQDAGGTGDEAPARWRAFWAARGVAFSQ
jgi:multisubunit Na+/H+ antiporter MnhC subunit